MGRLSLKLLVFLLCLLLHLHPSCPYSLKSCTIAYTEDVSADVVLDCTNRKLVTIPDDIPREANSVNLGHNQINRINKNDFGNLSKVRILFLYENEISDVDDGSFLFMVSLTRLYMSTNKLTNLTANLFQGLSKLTLLDLSSNSIQLIHPLAFQFLSSLQTVKLDTNKLRQITDIQPILQLPHLHNLSISTNLFPSFETKDLLLNTSTSLKVLDVSYNVFERFSITTQIFPHLEMIDLSRCGQSAGFKWDVTDKTLLKSITRLHFSHTLISFEDIQKVLQSLDSLMHLKLNYMDSWIHKGLLATVCEIPTLKKLNLCFNHVANLSAKLVTCSQLTELNLSCTDLTELSNGSILPMKRLRYLTVDTNLLTKVPDDIKSLSSLEILNLDDNLISELDCDDFLNTTRLTELYLNTNHISKLDSCVFEHLNHLKVLSISGNLLWTFGGAFKTGPHNLNILDVSKNFVASLDQGDFQGLGSLEYLDAVSNNIGRVKQGAFDGLNKLKTLCVSLPLEFENNFRGLQRVENITMYFNTDVRFKGPQPNDHEALLCLKSLKMFTIICRGYHHGFPFDIPKEIVQSMNHLEEFTADNVYISVPDPDTFKFNPNLKSLTLRQTDLSALGPELFQPIPNLQALDLSNTKLMSLDFLAQADLFALRRLTLTHNKITVINETIFQSLPALRYLDLNNNPFTCDCSNAGFIQWVKSDNQTQVVNGHEYTCFFPAAEQGNKLLDFDIQFCRIDVNFFFFISSTSIVLLTLLTAFILHFLRWHLVYTFYIFLAFLYDSKRRKRGTPHDYDAFISYNAHDEAWVYREMLPVLEGEQGWRLCLHHRDFQPGKPIIENITDAIYRCRKTICVISRHYLQSEWCSREIQMASFRLFDEQKDVLVLLFLEDIPAHQLSPYYRMRKLVKKRTYLSWLQAGQHKGVFWQNVWRALETGDDPADHTDLLTGPAGC
ncbi:toll-like receptor 13 isoform X1 [Larimichthys crocea]|uniref:toll-like receptor 13 isoform X1 n=1 Tax=Larimichthys crocea TaxID=215358 RepID=UPI000901492A|nr:toll-like receptor 13 isoform X1 [Larimichthys crocea]WOL43250.1 toll-like receptor 23 [Larimichthys crocea]